MREREREREYTYTIVRFFNVPQMSILFYFTEYAKNFQLVDEAATNDIPYDFDSIMHYDAYAFSSNNEPTIEPLDDSVSLDRLGQRDRLSQYDLDHIRELYCEGIA